MAGRFVIAKLSLILELKKWQKYTKNVIIGSLVHFLNLPRNWQKLQEILHWHKDVVHFEIFWMNWIWLSSGNISINWKKLIQDQVSQCCEFSATLWHEENSLKWTERALPFVFGALTLKSTDMGVRLVRQPPSPCLTHKDVKQNALKLQWKWGKVRWSASWLKLWNFVVYFIDWNM